ncbi:hypothetical protein HW555_004572 [Spodoptera exigua]|uniref:Peptidase S1 domain-containing protein n=1 Tax=Spodoptera exigua TaxID=7107 RepID=A0A835L8A7_SPOEX|nr:hypothetical protein HW555_004572 [Spodoptera exigua]KAH9631213.1 hypothetical protein HF086_005984 [Spodoptera exigua]
MYKICLPSSKYRHIPKIKLLSQTILSILIYVELLFGNSVIAKQRPKKNELDFQEVLKENIQYPPMVDKCPLRIVGGQKVDINEVPYQIVIQTYLIRNAYWILVCGGSIVTQRHVVTAAHCFPRRLWNRKTYRVLAGTGKLGSTGQSKEVQKYPTIKRKILSCFRHKYYNEEEFKHDFAVLTLDSPVNFTENVQAIPMLQPSHGIQLQINGLCVVSGFGVYTNYKTSKSLRIVCVPIVSTSVCIKHYYNYLQNHQFCAGTQGKDSCWGDSGGPITYKGYLVGVVSYGAAQCGWSPSVYTRISSYTSGENVPFVANRCVTSAIYNLLYINNILLFFVYNLFSKHVVTF